MAKIEDVSFKAAAKWTVYSAVVGLAIAIPISLLVSGWRRASVGVSPGTPVVTVRGEE